LDQILQLLIVLEILFVNLLTTHLCSKNKFSNIKVLATLLVFTVVFLYGILLFPLDKYPKVIFVLIGFIYFFPIKYLYEEKSNTIFTIMFFSWTHTITVNAISAEISKLVSFPNSLGGILTIQSIIYIVTTNIVIKFIKNKFSTVLENINKETNKSLILFGTVLFVTVILIRFYFSVYSTPYWTLTIIVLISMIAITGYSLIYTVVDNSKRIESLRQIAYYDDLTGINNRLALFLDSEELIANKEPFYLLYMDLDNFKNVNDTYGHDIGDIYLRSFTNTTIEVIQDKGRFYRMSGDEFICIYYGSNIDFFIAELDERILNAFDINIPFLGVSIGYAKYPDDCESIDQLIKKADIIMYHVKNSRVKTSNNADIKILKT